MNTQQDRHTILWKQGSGTCSVEAWVLRSHAKNAESPALSLTTIDVSSPARNEVLVEPLFGCWEGNMGHALASSPIDVCEFRKEDEVVLGNAGVVRVLQCGDDVSGLREGDTCMLIGIGQEDDLGFVHRAFAYDAPNTVGMLAKRTVVRPSQLVKLPSPTRLSLRQWAAFSARYVTAWANWQLAYKCWLAFDVGETNVAVWAWGGGVAFAQLTLAAAHHCSATMITSSDSRVTVLRAHGLSTVDRRHFAHLSYNEDNYRYDARAREQYRHDEEGFLRLVSARTEGRGVSIFFDHIGAPVFRATVKALGRPGIVSTAGWKRGMTLRSIRALECMGWHIHVHTHYARRKEALAAVDYAERSGWAPPISEEPFEWEEIPTLAERYERGELATYFPLFRVNNL